MFQYPERVILGNSTRLPSVLRTHAVREGLEGWVKGKTRPNQDPQQPIGEPFSTRPRVLLIKISPSDLILNLYNFDWKFDFS